MFPFGAIAATVWWKWRKWQSLRPLGRIIETNEGPAFCQSTQWRNASSSQQQCTCTCTQSVPSYSPVPLLYLSSTLSVHLFSLTSLLYLRTFQYLFCTFVRFLYHRTLQYPFCTFVLSITSSVPSFFPLPLLYRRSLQYPFCIFVLSSTSSVPSFSPVPPLYLSSTTIHCLLFAQLILLKNQGREMPSTSKQQYTTCTTYVPLLYLHSFLKSLSALS